jgi:hypothetical protein
MQARKENFIVHGTHVNSLHGSTSLAVSVVNLGRIDNLVLVAGVQMAAYFPLSSS